MHVYISACLSKHDLGDSTFDSDFLLHSVWGTSLTELCSLSWGRTGQRLLLWAQDVPWPQNLQPRYPISGTSLRYKGLYDVHGAVRLLGNPVYNTLRNVYNFGEKKTTTSLHVFKHLFICSWDESRMLLVYTLQPNYCTTSPMQGGRQECMRITLSWKSCFSPMYLFPTQRTYT